MIGAVLACKLGLFRRTRGGEHFRAHLLGKLHQQLADAAGCGMHQATAAVGQLAQVMCQVMRGAPWNREAAAISSGNSAGTLAARAAGTKAYSA